MKEKNLSNKRTTKVFNAVFQNIHAYILVIDKNLIVQKTNFYQRTNKVDDGKEKRVGDLLCCQNAIISGRCGTHKRCQDCVINGTITRAFNRKQSFSEIKATLTLSTEPDNYMQVEAIVSGSYIDMENEESMVVTIHNITNLMTNKRENERLN
ncbi:hypothetical protein LJC29_07335, partial [Bacteroides sp. OttesenSCG-928-N06]|nr:hypothetical protein [Bacteroides sp. OttesenSCG-928-N06]